MKAKTNLMLLGFLLILQINTAQNFKLEQVNKSEVEMTEDPVFKDVDAIVLQRNVRTVVGKYIEVYEKIKILTNDGLDYATVEVPYLGVFKLEGATYNLEDGEMKKTPIYLQKVKVDQIYNLYNITVPTPFCPPLKEREKVNSELV